MSAIAEILVDHGYRITGSDSRKSFVTDHLEEIGVKVYEGHSAKNISSDTDILVYSSAVSADNLERVEAKKRGLVTVRRAEMLAEVMLMKYGIGIAGTHGKTTTTAMTSMALIEAGLDPTVIIGGKVRGLGGNNARLGRGNYIIVEADEYDRTFLSLTPNIAVLTTLEEDHLDCYDSLADIKHTFLQFANKIPPDGLVIICLDEKNLIAIQGEIRKRLFTYGFNPSADLQIYDVKHLHDSSTFKLKYRDKTLGEIKLQIPGDYNVKNATAAVAIGIELGIPFSKVKAGIEKFTGVDRRWQKKGEKKGILVYDDYAHHPTECRSALEGAKAGWDRRLVCVFQPHLYSRTRDFYREFAKGLSVADVVIVTEIYKAREEPIKGVSGKIIHEEITRLGKAESYYLPHKELVSETLKKITHKGDLVVTMGAGDIYKYGEEFLKIL